MQRAKNMCGNICCHPKLFSNDISIITNINMMKYTYSNDISIILSMMLLNGLTNPKYATCNMNKNITASSPFYCLHIISNAVNMYLLVKFIDRNDLDMLSFINIWPQSM